MFEVTVNTRRAVVGTKELITTSSAGIQVQFTFSEDWDSLSKIAIFRNGDDANLIPVAVPNSNLVTIPAQSCYEEYVDEPIFVGVYGTDGLGAVIIPTIWASLGVLRPGAVTTDIITPAEPTPDMWAQILAIANEAAAIADECEANEELRVAAEQLRAGAEIARANAEALRAAAEDARAENENQRQGAETQRQAAEDARAQAEALRIQAEELRQANETSRVSAESDRASAEQTRQANEATRASNEAARVTTEQNRASAETQRASAESSRVTEETSRVSAESSRATAEQDRASAETARASAESQRVTAENNRVSAEQNRVNAEDERVQAETDRAAEFANWESNIASKVPNTRTVNGKALSTDITLDAGDIGYDDSETYQAGSVGAELQEQTRQLSDLEENQIPELKSALVNQGIRFFPDAMKADVCDYAVVAPTQKDDNCRYGAQGDLITGANGYCAIKVNVSPYDQMYITGANVGHDGTFRVKLMSGDTVSDTLGVGDDYTPNFTIPEGVDNVRFTCTLNNYANLIIKRLAYDSIASKYYAQQQKTKSVVPFTDVIITDNYRVDANGALVSATGYYAIEFNVIPGEKVTFFRSLLGYNRTFSIVVMKDSSVLSIISNSGIGATSGKYTLTVPATANKIKATGSLGNKYPYNIFKESVIDDNAISGNGYANSNGQKTYIVGNKFFPTVQSACDFADANDIIFIKSGTYNEAVSIWNKKLHLIGENKNTTIIIEHVGNYANPPLEMNIGSLSNLTLIEDGANAASDTAETGKLGAYCLHVEAINPNTEVFEVDNCVFKNTIHAPLGCGLQANYTIRFRNCTFICEAANEDYAHERGAFYVHTAVTTNPTGQHIIAENCVMMSANNIVVLIGIPSGATGSADYRFSGCTMWSAKRGIADNAVLFDINSTDATFTKVQSYGNTIAVLNS